MYAHSVFRKSFINFIDKMRIIKKLFYANDDISLLLQLLCASKKKQVNNSLLAILIFQNL